MFDRWSAARPEFIWSLTKKPVTGPLFRMYDAVEIASTQNPPPKPAPTNMDLALSYSVRFIRSAIPLLCGERAGMV